MSPGVRHRAVGRRVRAAARHALLAALAAAAVACAERRDLPSPACVTWPSDVAPLLAGCTACHGGAQPASGYDLTTYLGALGGGGDEVPNAIAGDAGSRLLARLDAAGDDAHRVPAATREVLGRWALECQLAALDSPLHAPGVLDPSSAQFHGATLAAQGWDLATCAGCHGDDFSGGRAGASCNGCHEGGPTSCQTCHPLDAAQAPRGTQGGARPYGAGALDGAHRRHAAAGLACAECHRVPLAWSDDGHVRRAGASGVTSDPPPAEIDFGAAARRGDASPSYDDGRCSGVYCHGATLRDGGAAVTAPTWRGGPGQAACGSCHGAPPASHADDRCEGCHPAAAARHLDGVTTVGRTAGCDGCHGDATSPAPPRDLSGATATTALGVGAHRAHLEGPRRLRGPIACATCHRVPTALGDAGHLDSAAPAEVELGVGWNRDLQSCATAWCHGPARPRWTSSGEVTCGSCHGVPPADAAHAPDLPLTACAGCHPRSVDAFGNILLQSGPTGLTSEHLDGDVDLP